jgi:hypothetical protein
MKSARSNVRCSCDIKLDAGETLTAGLFLQNSIYRRSFASVRKPNFFIVGAPKCGTTSLAIYLGGHTQIFFPANKEPHFFNTDMKLRNARTKSEYYANFRGAGSQHAAVGEGSVHYLYSDAAVPNILRAIPDARFIVMLRNPIDMALSWYTEVRYTGNEDIREFASAWRMQEVRRTGRAIPLFCRDPSLLLYGRVCSLSWQMRRLYSRVPRERVLVLLLDDLRTSARSVYLRTLEFLGVPDDRRMPFGVHNQRHKPVRSQFAQAGIRIVSRLKMRLGIRMSLGLLRPIQFLNTVREEGDEMLEPQFKAELRDYFRDDVGELSALVERDLSGWLRV